MERYSTRKLIKRFNELYNYSLTFRELVDAYEIPLTKSGRMNRRYKKRINKMRNELINDIANAVANAVVVIKPNQEDLQKALNALNELREYNSAHDKINLKQYILYKPMIEELKGTVADRLNLSIPQKFKLLHENLHLNVEAEHGSSGHVTNTELYINGDADGADETILGNAGLSGFMITNITADKSNDVEVEEIVGIYANDNMDCVDVFKDYYGITDEQFPGREALLRKLYNGIYLSDFIEIVDELGICEVYDNYKNKLNKTVSDNKAMYFNNHIIPTLPKEPAAKKREIRESITDLYLQYVKNHEYLTNIRIHTELDTGNHEVSTFETKDTKYVRRCGDRNIALAEYRELYGCSWFNNYEKNVMIFNEHSGESLYQIDCVRAYSNAYNKTSKIPIISNIRTKYPIEDYIVCVEISERFQLLLTKENFEKYKKIIPMKVIYYQRVIEWRTFERIELEKQDINELLGCCLISGNVKRVQLITQRMDNLTIERRTLNKHYYPVSNSYLCNLHFAVMNNFYPLMFDLFKYSPIVFNVDSLYFSKEDYEKVIKNVANKKDYHFNGLQKILINNARRNINRNLQIVLSGSAGSGKTHLIRDLIKDYKPFIMSTTNRLQNLWDNYNYSTLARVLKRHQLPEAEIYIIDEVFQCNTQDLNDILGIFEFYKLPAILIGDDKQFKAVGLSATELFEISNMKKSAELFSNYRNDIDYKKLNGRNIKEYFDAYITCCKYDSEQVNYAFRNVTMNKYKGKKFYKATATKELNTKNLTSLKLFPERKNGSFKVFNGEYYDYNKINDILLTRTLSTTRRATPNILKPTSIKSIYTTQGQTMREIRVLIDDYDHYISNLTLCYVLISRICNGKRTIDARDEKTKEQIRKWISSHASRIHNSKTLISIYDDTLYIKETAL